MKDEQYQQLIIERISKLDECQRQQILEIVAQMIVVESNVPRQREMSLEWLGQLAYDITAIVYTNNHEEDKR